jgi:toxin ParE1/3/4
MGEIRWTEKASSNLQGIYDYIARDSKTYAAHLVKALINATSKLQTLPRCGRLVPEFESLGLREVIYQNYRIVYRVKDTRGKDIEILAVVHGAREIKTVAKREWELGD